MRIADIACGSGTFLLEVYQFLLDWYLAHYVTHLTPLLLTGHAATSSEVRALLPDNDPAPAGKRGRKTDGLAADLRSRGRRVAADHGRAETHPDDAHLRCGHRPAGRGADQVVAAVEGAGRRERADAGQPAPPGSRSAPCPTWARNIKCGNSLIGPEFSDGQQLGLLNDDERHPDQRVRLDRGVPGSVPLPVSGEGPGVRAALRRAQGTVSTPSSATRRTSASRP